MTLGDVLLARLGGLAEDGHVDPLDFLIALDQPLGRDGKLPDRHARRRVTQIGKVFTEPADGEKF